MDYAKERLRMVDEQIAGRGVKDERVLAAMRKVPRHEFLPEAMHAMAYADNALPIGENQTMYGWDMVWFSPMGRALSA